MSYGNGFSQKSQIVEHLRGSPYNDTLSFEPQSIQASLLNLDGTAILILSSLTSVVSGVEVTQLQQQVPLAYSALSRRLLELAEAGLLSRTKSVDTSDPRSQPYLYFLAPGVTATAIESVISKRQIDIQNIKLKLEKKHLRRRERQKGKRETVNPILQEEKDTLGEQLREHCTLEDNFQEESLQETSFTQQANQIGIQHSAEYCPIHPSSPSSPLVTEKMKTVSLEEVLEMLEEMAGKIVEQDSRIAQLEKQLSVFQSSQTTKDTREILRNIRSKLNLNSESIHEGTR